VAGACVLLWLGRYSQSTLYLFALLAMNLNFRPDLLLLDEPTNMLDMKAVYWLENHLQVFEFIFIFIIV
jgi:ABC-type molybdenum transport system ATPase subunit/photorepair protein PhrA